MERVNCVDHSIFDPWGTWRRAAHFTPNMQDLCPRRAATTDSGRPTSDRSLSSWGAPNSPRGWEQPRPRRVGDGQRLVSVTTSFIGCGFKNPAAPLLFQLRLTRDSRSCTTRESEAVADEGGPSSSRWPRSTRSRRGSTSSADSPARSPSPKSPVPSPRILLSTENEAALSDSRPEMQSPSLSPGGPRTTRHWLATDQNERDDARSQGYGGIGASIPTSGSSSGPVPKRPPDVGR